MALRIFPTVSVKVLPNILPNFLYKEPKHTTAALKRHFKPKKKEKKWNPCLVHRLQYIVVQNLFSGDNSNAANYLLVRCNNYATNLFVIFS